MLAPLLALLCLPVRAKELGRLTSPDGLTLVFRASPVANLTYQLDCLAQITRCTRQSYDELWKNGDWTAEDDAAVARWAALIGRLPSDVQFGSEPDGEAKPQPPRGVDLRTRTRIAGLKADGWDDYASSLDLLLPPRDAQEALDITGRFLPRFERWWLRSGRAQSETAAAGLLSLSRKDDLPGYFSRVARFYGDERLAGQTVEFDFVALPSSDAHHSSGEELENYAEIEAVPGEQAEDRIDVVAHELFHYFFARGAGLHGDALFDAFASAPQPASMAAYGLLNEALAAALGNGLVYRRVTSQEDFQRKLEMEQSLYADPLIDGAAKALIPPIERWLSDGTRVGDPAFVSGYLDAVSRRLGPKLFSPAAWFRDVELLYGPGQENGPNAFIETLSAYSAWTYPIGSDSARSMLRSYPVVSAAFFLRPGDAEMLRSWSQLLDRKETARVASLARARKAFVYGIKRSEKAYVYLFIAPDDASRDSLITAFAGRPSLFTGVMP